jgi:aspartate aminotransferase
MSISQLARSISASSTFALNEKARLLRERGEPVISLGIGEPKNKTPITAVLSTAAKLSEGNVKYTPPDGTLSLKKAIIRYTEENYNRYVEPKNIVVSSGAKQSLFNAIVSILNPQDEVILLAPYWVSYPEIVKLAYGIPVIVTPEDGSFRPRFEEIERAVSPYTKAIIVNSPNNPSGIVYSDELLSDIVEMCEKKSIYLIADDIYQKLVFDGKNAKPAYSFTNKDIESTMVIVVNGVSKLYGMTGFRIGWITANKSLVEVMSNIQSQITSGTSVLLQAAAEGALTGMQSVVENLRLTFENNRNVIMQELRTFNDVKVIKPEGAFYCLPDFRAYSIDSVELANHILNKALVVTIPGIDFGMEGHLRLSFAGSIKDIISGIERIKWSLDPNSPNEIYIGDRKYIRDWL